MPTYEYRCATGEHRLEVVQRISDDPLTECPECGAALKRVFHPVGVVLKGSGFYATDNRSKKALSPSEKSSDSKGGAKSEAKKEPPAATSGSDK